MPDAPQTFDRPQRWDASFDPEMSDRDVDRLLTLAPFKDMDPARFPKRAPLREILKHDTRIRKFGPGEIIVREGDYGTSAFMIISGKARVVISPDLPASVLGRRSSAKKNIFRVFAQLWNPREPETRKPSELKQDSRVAARESRNEVRVFLQDVPRVLDEHKTAIIDEGDFFGELAALSRMPRTASVFAEGDAQLLEIRWQGLRDLMRNDEALQKHIDEIYRARALTAHLREIPIFQKLTDAQLQQVIAQTEFGTYGDYDWSGDYKRLAQKGDAGRPDQEQVVAEEGHYPNGVILIRAGFARLSERFGHGHRTLNYLGCGQSYGLREIAHNWREKTSPVPLQYTLRVIGYTHVVVVPTAVMEKVVLPAVPKELLPPVFSETEISKSDGTIAGEKSSGTGVSPVRFKNNFFRKTETHGRDARATTDAGAKIGPDMMEFLTENRFFNGTATMVIDLDRCTRCDDCVRACACAHENNPRFLRNGPISGNIMIANACMHCADPVCMIGCPTGAIHRDAFGGQVVINQSTCIGCKTCANNCPYEAIRMVEIRDEDGKPLMDQQLEPILKATKCDLCVEQMGGPSCERACPHGALRRINMNDLDKFARWLAR